MAYGVQESYTPLQMNFSELEYTDNLYHLNSSINDSLFIELFFNDCKLASIHYNK